jgi:exosortase A-associated hydrolase 2
MAGPSAAPRLRAEPFFLESGGRRLFAVHHQPESGVPLRGHVLCVPPFNEEMNRSRSMLTLQARAFAQQGLGMLLVDLHGTGDSEGDHVDARWALWLEDLQSAQAWLARQPGGCVGVLALRLGAILAAQFLASSSMSRQPVLPLLLWQPVADGKMHLTQFMRVRMAAQLDRPDLPKETTAGMRQQLAAGQPLEVAGYEIHPELAAAIDAARLTEHVLPAGSRVLWLENASPDKQELAPASQTAVAAWQGKGVAVDAQTFAGPAFWQVHERMVAPAVIEQGSAWLQKQVAAA